MPHPTPKLFQELNSTHTQWTLKLLKSVIGRAGRMTKFGKFLLYNQLGPEFRSPECLQKLDATAVIINASVGGRDLNPWGLLFNQPSREELWFQ